MEKEEIDHITKHLDDLVQFTTCNTTLLNILEQNYILSREDVQEVTKIHLTEFARSRLLYKLLEGRKSAYSVLILALRGSQQSGAYTILEELWESQEYISAKKPKFQKYLSPPSGVAEFIQEKPSTSWAFWKTTTATKTLIISSSDINITETKIRDTSYNHVNWINEEEFIKISRIAPHDQNAEKIYCIRTSNVANFLHNVGSTSKKLLIITSEQKSTLNEILESCKQWKITTKIEEDVIQWKDLSPQFVETIADRTILFQNNPLQLKNLFRFFKSSESIQDQQKQLSGHLLAALINDQRPQIFKNTIPPPLQYYVSRQIISRSTISVGLFKKDIPDVFVFTDIERNVLIKLVGPNQGGSGRTDTSSNQKKEDNLSVRFILLHMKRDFAEICKRSSSVPVHWLRYENGVFIWVKSGGDMRNLDKLVDTAKQVTLNEDKFLEELYSDNSVDKSTMPACIADAPGMGKTVLLSSIGRRIQGKHADRVVIFVIFSEYIALVKREHDESSELSVELLTRILGSFMSEYDMGEFLFNSGVKSGTLKVEILFDGYDEINYQDLELAKSCLQLIIKSLQSARVVVSTRSHLLLDLENALETIGFKISAFSQSDQTQFLTRYWRQNKLLEENRLKKYAEHCLRRLNKNLTDRDKEIAGIPLLCLPVGQVYEETAVAYSDPKNMIDSNVAPDEVDITCITDLFEQAVLKKLENYKSRYNVTKIDTTGLERAHIYESLRLIFPSQAFIWMEIIKPYAQNADETLIKIGILEASGRHEIPRFIHRTFAEYFLAVFAKTCLINQERKDTYIPEMLFSAILSTHRVRVYQQNYGLSSLNSFSSSFNHQMTIYFLNSRLSKPTQDNWDCIETKIMSSSNRGDLALACANDDLPCLLRYLLQSKIFELAGHSFLNENFMIVAALNSSVQVFQILKEYVLNYEQIIKDPLSILNAAVSRGDITVLEYLCHNETFKKTVVRSDKDIQHNLLHSCVQETLFEEEGLINQKIQIMRLLIPINRNLLNQKDLMEGTPIFSAYVHIRLLQELVSAGINLLDTVEGKTVLHHHSMYLSSEQFLQFLLCIPESVCKHLLNIRDTRNQTPVHCFLKYQEPSDVLLNFLSRSGVNLGEASLLSQAFAANRSAHCFRRLIEFGADWKSLKWRGGGSVLHVACETGSVDVVSFLLSLDIDVNVADDLGNTPLHYAVQNVGGSQQEIVNLLLSRGANTMSLNKQQENILHASIGNAQLETIQLIIDQRLVDINAKDSRGNTPLHLLTMKLLKESDNDTVRLLLGSGADVNAKNSNDATPLWLMLKRSINSTNLVTLSLFVSHGGLTSPQMASAALRYFVRERFGLEEKSSYESLAEECVNKGADLGQTDTQGRSLLHIAATYVCLRGVKWLMETLGHAEFPQLSINFKDNDGNTPLHCAVRSKDRKRCWETVKYLVDMGANVFTQNNKGETAVQSLVKFFELTPSQIDGRLLHLLECSSEVATTILKLLIEQPVGGTGSRHKKYEGDLPSVLLARGVDIEHLNERGQSLLHFATQTGCLESVMFFVDQGCNVKLKDSEGNTPCHFSMKNKYTNEMEHLRFFQSRGADMFTVNNVGESILHSAVLHGKPAAVQYLLSLNCEVNTQTKMGNAPLHIAFSQRCGHQQYRVIRSLIEGGGDVNALNTEGFVVADLAVKTFQAANQKQVTGMSSFPVPHIMKLLVDNGLDLGRKNGDGNTILHLLPTFLTASEFHECVLHLVTTGKGPSLSVRNSTNETVLKAAGKHFKLLDETLNLLKSTGMDLEGQCENTDSVAIKDDCGP